MAKANIVFEEAKLGRSNVFLGITGPTGSGKTKSALRVASGLKSEDGTIYVIDTEGGRALHYANEFKFRHARLEAPFTYARYLEYIEATRAKDGDVVIVDSASHAHEGPGGLLEQHDAELQKMAGDNWERRDKMNFAAWIKPKAEYTRFVNRLQQMNVNVIMCFRAKEKMVMVRNKGKVEPVSIGWQPICTEGLAYEMTAMLVLPPGSEGVPNLAAEARKMPSYVRAIFEEKQLDEETGVKLAWWAKGGTAKAKKEKAQPKAATKAAKTPPHDPETGELTDTDTRGTDPDDSFVEQGPQKADMSGHDPKVLYANEAVAMIEGGDVRGFLKWWYGLDDEEKAEKLTEASYHRFAIALAKHSDSATINSWARQLTDQEREMLAPVRETVRDYLRKGNR